MCNGGKKQMLQGANPQNLRLGDGYCYDDTIRPRLCNLFNSKVLDIGLQERKQATYG